MTLHYSPILAQSLSVFHDNGETLFTDVSFSLEHQITGLVGRNGSGKSVLANVLLRQKTPDAGNVVCQARVGFLPQLTRNRALQEQGSIASFLSVEEKLRALRRIENGSIDQQDFDLVADDWGAWDALCLQLDEMNIPADPLMPCYRLSGGELTRLMLWQLFNGDYDFLILDEPSNHLDRAGRKWLLEQMRRFDGGILLISHDRLLLECVACIMELTAKGIRHYGGNYSLYSQQKELQQVALDRSVADAERQVRQIKKQQQRSIEKAQKRATHGNKARRDGSQPKILLDAMKDSAQRTASARKVQFEQQLSKAEKKAADLKDQQYRFKSQQLMINESDKRHSSVLALLAVQLRYGFSKEINFSMQYGDRVHLTGNNGCGKSTLLKAIMGNQQPNSGQVLCKVELCYLDQHFSLLDDQQTVLENLQQLCPDYSQSELRTMAAGVGFRRERVNLSVALLSGGEKMKIALLVVSHQYGETLLLLDEPDNHLDIESKQMLAQALSGHMGGMVLISHDDAFVAEVGINRTLMLGVEPG
ncbi:ATP-binding cassette domain-containing protein [Photobacterium sp. SDRW27]|uniref:ABC-F family ATP-binding cassette domain-containing protein n=1 Tax=Photobacterium obscurum TaxID=2829490 RepID=UPI002244DA55|nr:ATP-binding cassette domain-containing protein [Photobacterium obscurum]MCW8328425.1 ATP-binding cassette domain-containing protein [Photobacterium obscurum]